MEIWILLLHFLFSIPLLTETDFNPFVALLDLVCLQNECLSCLLQADILDLQLYVQLLPRAALAG